MKQERRVRNQVVKGLEMLVQVGKMDQQKRQKSGFRVTVSSFEDKD